MSENLVTVKGQVTQEERAALEALASADTRSLSQIVRLAVRAYLEKRAA